MADFNGGSGDDIYEGGPGGETIDGNGGNDILSGGAGADTIDGGDGNDTLYSHARSPAWERPFFGNNPVFTPPVLDVGSEVDVLRGGAGYDTIYAGYGDFVDGGADGGDLLISFQGAAAGLNIDFRALANGGTLTIGGGTITNIFGVMWIEGSEFDDVLTGSDVHGYLNNGYAPIFGRGGNDTLTAGVNTGNIYGGDGNDVINSNYTGGYYYGEDGDDVINAYAPLAVSYGGAGNDTLNVVMHAYGGAGDDVITMVYNPYYDGVGNGDDGNDRLYGTDGTSRLAGGTGADILYGYAGNDWLYSAGPEGGLFPQFFPNGIQQGEEDRGTEHDQLFGGDNDDWLSIGYGDDADGGTGTNTLVLSLIGAGAGITLNVADLITGGPYVIGGGTITHIQKVAQLWGTNFADTLTLVAQANVMPVYGMDGDDVITGTGGVDEIHGGLGADTIDAGGGNDTISVDAAGEVGAGEQLNGGSGTDTLITNGSGDYDLSGATLSGIEILKASGPTRIGLTAAQLAGVTTLYGGFYFTTGGNISLSGISAPLPVFFNLAPAGNHIDLTGFTPGSFCVVGGDVGNDTVIGSEFSDNIYGNDGDDFLYGNGGSDTLDGGAGNDLLEGGAGTDTMVGGLGNDVYFVDNSGDVVTELTNEGTDEVRTTLATYSLVLRTNVENLTGFNATGQTLIGNGNANVIIGGVGNDTINGLTGADTMIGGQGNDVYIVDNAGDIASELAGAAAGTADEVRTSLADYSLPDNVEILTATAPATAQALHGNAGDNIVTGSGQGDSFRLEQGGNDAANGGGGDDGFYFGAAFTAADHVDGGAGANDQIGLQGNYVGANALVLGANTIVNVEAIAVLHDATGGGFSYDITMVDANVAAGGLLKVQATLLHAGESLHFDGSAEHDGTFMTFGGQGDDSFVGGDGNDGFYFGPGGYTSADVVNGGPGGNDQLGLDGDYGSAGSPLVLGSNVTNVEVVVLMAGPAGTPNHFNVSTSDVFVGAGQTMTIFGLQTSTGFTFTGANEHDGAFKVYGGTGNDSITGSDGADWLFGAGGSDAMSGGAGADTFYYDAAAQSTSLGFDTITGFDDSADVIDLPFAVTGLASPASGNLSNGSFDADLSTAFAGLTSHQAGMFTATGGDMAGRTFLVIDADGNAGYQAGSDYVIEIVSPVTPVDNPAIFV